MRTVIFQHKPSGEGVTTEYSKFNLFKNSRGQVCYSFDCNRFDRHPGTSSGWVKMGFDPQTKRMVKFDRCAHYTNFDIYNYSAGGPERALTVYLVAENDEEENLVMNCQTCVKLELWGFRVCLIPDLDFYPSGSYLQQLS